MKERKGVEIVEEGAKEERTIKSSRATCYSATLRTTCISRVLFCFAFSTIWRHRFVRSSMDEDFNSSDLEFDVPANPNFVASRFVGVVLLLVEDAP